MFVKVTSMLLLFLWMNNSTGIILPDCSRFKPPSNFPSIWVSSKNLEDDVLLILDQKVKQSCNETRKFKLWCWAPYPISIGSNSMIEDKNENINQIKKYRKLEYFKHDEIFMASSSFIVKPEEKVILDAFCIPVCNTTGFFYGVKIFTKADGKYFSKIVLKRVSSNYSDSSRYERQLFLVFMYVIWVFIFCMSFVLFTLILPVGKVFCREGISPLENIQLNNLSG